MDPLPKVFSIWPTAFLSKAPPWELFSADLLFEDFLLFFAIPFTLFVTVAVFEFAIEKFLIPEGRWIHCSRFRMIPRTDVSIVSRGVHFEK
jgi:hypothetical protein